jgi:hypothetical protein
LEQLQRGIHDALLKLRFALGTRSLFAGRPLANPL